MRGPIVGRNPSDGSSNPFIAIQLNSDSENPYQARGFSRLAKSAAGIKSYLCFSLETAPAAIMLYDVLLAMVYFISFFNAKP